MNNTENKLKDIEKSMKFLLVSILFLTVSFSFYVDIFGRDFISFMIAFSLVINLYMTGKLMIVRWKVLDEQGNNTNKGE